MDETAKENPGRPQAGLPVGELSYASRMEFETALFRVLGWFSLMYAGVRIARLVVDLVQLAYYRLPQWWMILDRMRNTFWTVFSPEEYSRWVITLQSPIQALIALFLLAGAIGCLRRYPRTRWWLLSYACLAMANAATFAIAMLYLLYARNYLSNGSQGRMFFASTHEALLETATILLDALPLPIIFLWLMTRPHVDAVFQPKDRA